MRYYLQHGAGLSELVEEALKNDLDEFNVVFNDDSSLVLESPVKQDWMTTLPYVKNAFLVLGDVPRGSLPSAIDQVIRTIRKGRLLRNQPAGLAFRTMTNVDGKLVGLPRETRSRLESTIAAETGGRFDARGGTGVEYWVIGRRDLSALLFCRRLTACGQKGVAKGSLSSDLATLLVKASIPQSDDFFLDPFGGSGSIVAARIETSFRKALYADTRLDELRPQFSPALLRSGKIELLNEDALYLPSVSDGEVSCIVTDPPWGEYEELRVPYDTFAASMMKSFDRVLHRHHGRLVMMLSRRASATVAEFWDQSNLSVRASHNILVNGHPATVLAGGRRQLSARA